MQTRQYRLAQHADACEIFGPARLVPRAVRQPWGGGIAPSHNPTVTVTTVAG